MARARREGPWIGLDLGGTKVYGVRLEGDTVVAEAKRKTPLRGGPDAVVDTMAAVVDALGGAGAARAVGVGAPGAVDEEAGVVRTAPNLPHFAAGNVPLKALLEERIGGLPVTVSNDVSVAVHAEWKLGAGRGLADFVGIWIGTGVGGGLVLDGRLRTGESGAAGEIGHTVVVFRGGRRCGCGGRGHLEAYAGRGALEREARARAAKGDKTVLVKLAGTDRMTSSVFAKALDQGDPLARRLVADAARALGAGAATAAALLDVGTVMVGGGLADRLGKPFVERIQREASKRLFPGIPSLRVVAGEYGDQAGAVGAALLAAGR